MIATTVGELRTGDEVRFRNNGGEMRADVLPHRAGREVLLRMDETTTKYWLFGASFPCVRSLRKGEA